MGHPVGKAIQFPVGDDLPASLPRRAITAGLSPSRAA